MKETPPKRSRVSDVLAVGAILAAVVWMAVILLSGVTAAAHAASGCFVVLAAASTLLRYRSMERAPDEKPAPLPFLRRAEKPESYCPFCGGAVRKADIFCPKCGKKME